MTKVAIGKGIELEVDFGKLPKNVQDHVVYMGLRNVLMDSHASHTKEADGDNYVANSQATAERKLAAMYAGEVRAIGTRESDPVKAEAIRFATNQVKAYFKAKGQKNVDAKDIRAAALLLIEKNPSIMVMAEKRVAENKAASVDLSELGI
jgi:hypothetical protein